MTYDAEQTKSLPSAFLFDGEGGYRQLDRPDHASENITAHGFTWLRLNYSDPDDQRWLYEQSELEPLVIDALLAEETRPRTTILKHGVLIALRGVNLTPGADPHDMVTIRIWITPNQIITTHRRELQAVRSLIEEMPADNVPLTSTALLIDLIDRLIWNMSDTVDNYEETMADFEGRIIESDTSTLRYDLSSLRRQVITMRRYLSPQREALSRLITEKISWIDDNSRIHLREVNDRLIRHIEDLDTVRERAVLTQEELLSHLSEQLNTRIYVLAIVSAVFLPLGLLTGLFGINVGGVPGAENPLAFWIFLALLFVLVGMQLILFRLKRWL